MLGRLCSGVDVFVWDLLVHALMSFPTLKFGGQGDVTEWFIKLLAIFHLPTVARPSACMSDMPSA